MKTATQNELKISINMDGIWAGSGDLRDGVIENCGAQFCDDNDVSLGFYESIEEAIEAGHDSVTVEIDGTSHVLSWSIT